MPITEHICHRCGHIFKRKLHLERHLNKKNQCKYLQLDDDGEVIQVNTDDVILQEDNLKFDDLEPFPFEEYVDKTEFPTVLLCAVRYSGKTTLIKHCFIPYAVENFDIVILISNSVTNKKVYGFLDGSGVLTFENDNPQMIKDILRFQKRTNQMFKIAVIFDDAVSYKRKNDDAKMQLFVRGRNMSISVFPLSTQSTTLVNKNNRGNSDVVYIGNSPGEFQEVVIEKFLQYRVPIPKHIKTKTQKNDYLHKFLDHHTKDHGFIVVDNRYKKLYGHRLQLN